MWSAQNLYLAAAAVCSPSTTEGAFGQSNVLDDLGKVQIDLQQQVLAPLAHRAKSHKISKIVWYGLERSQKLHEHATRFEGNTC